MEKVVKRWKTLLNLDECFLPPCFNRELRMTVPCLIEFLFFFSSHLTPYHFKALLLFSQFSSIALHFSYPFKLHALEIHF